jgi:hypothetical protein
MHESFARIAAMTGEREIPDWQLELYLLGELSDELKEKIEKRLEMDISLRKQLDALCASNREILSSYPPELMTERIVKRSRERFGKPYGKLLTRAPTRPLLRRMVLALSLAAVVMAVLLPLRTLLRQGEESGPEEGIRLKGFKPHLVVYRKSGGVIERLEDGALASEGDVIQLSYVAGPGTYGVVYSIDGRGAVTLHYPVSLQDSAPELQGSGEASLPYAYQLDDAPSFERFFLVTSDEEFPISEVEKAVRALSSNPVRAQQKRLNLPSTFDQFSVILRKEKRRS